ncbi:type II toxin-antitoxin system RelE/ParE family toxin [Rhodanobacter lindaniclasticus]
MRRFDLTKAAKADLKSIANFTQSRWGVRQRNAYLKEMDLVFLSLAKNPRMGKACDEIRDGYQDFLMARMRSFAGNQARVKC